MSSEEDNLNSLHKVYTNDPLLFMTYVGKEVKITTKDKNVYYGIVYTLDPVSERLEKNCIYYVKYYIILIFLIILF